MAETEWYAKRHGLIGFVVERRAWSNFLGSAYEYARDGKNVIYFLRRKNADRYAFALNQNEQLERLQDELARWKRQSDDWEARGWKFGKQLDAYEEAIESLIERWEKLAESHGVRSFTGNDHLLFANELRAVYKRVKEQQ